MMRGAAAKALGAAVVVLAISGALVWSARRIPVDVPPPPDYDRADAWLCRPGRPDPCAAPVTATVFAPGGGTHVVAFAPDPQAPIDCFYVYPTVSRVRAAYSPIAATSQEIGVVRDQFARFAGVCRPFAPLYRQVTSAGLPLLFGGRRGVTIDVPYRDVLAAWKSYLAKDNAGRGVVLIGHSQGSRLLVRLIAEEIDGKPEAAKLVSAIVPGTRVDVPPGEPVGGTYRRTPLCTAAPQTGCVIAYSSYPADRAMPSNPRFGVTSTPGMRFACVNPMALDGTASLAAELPMMAALETRHPTDLAEIPGLLSATCAATGPVTVLSVRVHPTDAAGDMATATLDRIAKQNPAFGLHPLDINIALGTLVDLVRRETATYLHR